MNIKSIIKEELNNLLNNNVYYHGGKTKIDKFVKTQSINRNGNVEGFYFTNNIDIAKNYGNQITQVKLNISNPFILGKSNVNENMIKKYAQELHNENQHLPIDGIWIKEKCDYFITKKYMPYTGMDGYTQQLIYKYGGFDSVIDGHEIAVFDTNDITILNDSPIQNFS